jgi:protein TonB
MAYADRDRRATQVTAAILVGAGTVAFLTGLTVMLNFQAIKHKFQQTTTIDPTKEPPKPPPPKKVPEPPKKIELKVTVVPPPRVNIAPPREAPPPPPPAAPPPVVVVPQPKAPPPPPPPPPVVRPIAKVNLAMDAEDYPASAQRNGEQGTSHISFTVSTDGRVTSCSSSGATPTLDQAACAIAERRWRFKPATQDGSPISTTMTQNVRWVLPKDE